RMNPMRDRVDAPGLDARFSRLRSRARQPALRGGVQVDDDSVVTDRDCMHPIVERGTAELVDRNRAADHTSVDPLVEPYLAACEEELRLEDLLVEAFRDDEGRRLQFREEPDERLD